MTERNTFPRIDEGRSTAGHSFPRLNGGRLGWRLLLLLVIPLLLAAPVHAADLEYRLAAGDNIRIVVFQNPDLTMEARVTEGGAITYPLIGLVEVGGMTIPEAEKTIATKLKDGGFIQQPQVNILLLQNRGNQVSVLGQVNRPGRFPLETFNIRLSEMLAIAGGISPTGADVAILTGLRNGKPFRKEIDIAGMFLRNRTEDDVIVAGGDVIYVHRQPIFFVYGEVQRPGSYRIERGMTIRQALAQGGGPTVRGTESGLRLHRRNGTGQVETLNPEIDSLVQPDDVLYVRQGIF
jgi:polysaccharide export outer membrane protein